MTGPRESMTRSAQLPELHPRSLPLLLGRWGQDIPRSGVMAMEAVRFVLLAAVCSASSPASAEQAQTDAVAATDSLVEAVVYTTLRPPNWDIYLFEKSGSPPRALIDDPALDYNAVFSPDGRWVVFTSERIGNVDLYALELEAGVAPVRLTYHRAMDDAATFSPDGRRIVFRSGRDGNMAVYVVDGDGRDPRRLTDTAARQTMPALSPDGEWVVFTSNRGGFNDEWPLTPNPQPYGDLWAVPVAGGPAIRLTDNKWEDGPNDWGYVRLPTREP